MSVVLGLFSLLVSVVLDINVRVNVCSLLFPCLDGMVHETGMFWISGIVGEVISNVFKEAGHPRKSVANGRNGITKPFNGSTNMSINSLSSCLRKN